jgi:hypothetical protein
MASIEEIIHAAYAANPYLTALVPATRFVTGTAKGMGPPYVTISREGSLPAIRSNGKRVDRIVIRFQVWATHSAGEAVRETLINYFDNWESDTLSPRVISMRKANDLAIEEDDGIWQFLIDFEVMTQAR